MADKPPLEFRMAQVDNVDFAERVITVIAVPYEQPAKVEYRGELWDEVFERSAFDGIENKQGRVPVYLQHRPENYVGQTQTFYPQRDEGLVADLRMFPTEEGTKALQIAADDGFSSSIGFAIRGSDQVLDRSKMVRRIKRAFIVDHIALVPQPAYEGAKVLSVRDATAPDAAPSLKTPSLDEFMNDPLWQWTAQRLSEERADTQNPYGDVKYADPGYKNGVKKYPIDTEAHARAALSYFSMPKNHQGYTAEQIAAIMGRIKGACKRFGIQMAA